jgi:queuosine precursor transporter
MSTYAPTKTAGFWAPALVFTAFASTIPAANWLIGNWGAVCIPQGPCLVPVGFGLMAPSGVLMIGLALVLRDWLHELVGWKWAFAAVLFGGALSLVFSPPALAAASTLAFVFAELADTAVYARLRARGRPLAVLASQVVGAFLDSALFVFIAFGSFEFSLGTTLGKLYAGVAVAALLWGWQRRGRAS